MGLVWARQSGHWSRGDTMQRVTERLSRKLYLSRAIAESHRGTLEIDGAPGRGTRVRASIPLSDDG